MKFLAVATLFFTAVLAAPTEVYAPPTPTYSVPANGGVNNPHGNVPPTGNKPPGGNTPTQPGNTSDAFDDVCPGGLFSNPQCCATAVLGLVGLDCSTPSATPMDGKSLRNICAIVGKQALCCVAPVAGQGVLCQPAIGAQ